MQRRAARLGVVAAALAGCLELFAGEPPRLRFFPDDPIWVDDDRAFDASGARPIEESDILDFARHTFFAPGDRRDLPAANVNTLDEVPDSSWFTNRIGRRAMSREELVRGPDRFDAVDVQDWPVVAGKSEGIQPGYRVASPDGRLWQVEFDPPSNPEMATGAEIVGTTFYHAFGYNVVEIYPTVFDPARVTVQPTATIRDLITHRDRPFTRKDLDAVLARAARRPDGRIRAIVGRFADGQPLGSFRYFGTRPDDPNDIHPHEHRRELRANRVFAAWLNHDDSRGLNSLDMLETRDGRKTITHYMFDFGSTLGSGTVRPQVPRAGNEYILEWTPGLLTGLTLGMYFKPWVLIDYPAAPPAAGRFEGDWFRPLAWRPEYPNPAFDNMRPEDAFWAARIVARFDEAAVRAIVGKAAYTDPKAADYIVATLMKRREKVLQTWLNGVLPLVDPRIEGRRLLATNAAVAAGAASGEARYTARWFVFDNATRAATHVGAPMTAEVSTDSGGQLSLAMPEGAEGGFVGVTIDAQHPSYTGWASHPATFFFRRDATRWEHVGTQRHP